MTSVESSPRGEFPGGPPGEGTQAAAQAGHRPLALLGVSLGYFVGNWFDRHHGTAPWGLLVGVMLGLASGMYLLIKDAIRMNKD